MKITSFCDLTYAYGYDDLDRLASETESSGVVRTYAYDLAGNRLSKTQTGAATITYSLGVGDRLATYTGGAYTHDDAGCVTAIDRTGKPDLDLTWNGQYQLTSVSTNGVVAESYAYDPLGRRASTTAGGVTVRHVYDGIHCVADLDAAGAVVRSYIWGPGIDNLLAVTCHSGSSATTYYAITDIQGTVHGFADAGGNLVESYAYDAWGNVLAVRDGNGLPIANPQSQIQNRFLFQGREYSWTTGLYNFRLRWYDPAAGRWLSKDPIGISGGLNLYAFCDNDPVNFVDPNGLWGVQFGSLNLGVGDPWLAFDSDSLGDIGRGAAATADGMIPGFDPFESIYADECGNFDSAYQFSRIAGAISGNLLSTAAGLGATKAINAALMPKTLYHFTSAEGAASIAANGGINASMNGMYGMGTYLTGFNNAAVATIQGARNTSAVIAVSTEGLKVSATYFPGTYIVRSASVLLR